MEPKAPIFNRQFVCIVDFQRLDMAAIISSYLSRKGTYLPFFEFPDVGAFRDAIARDLPDEQALGRQRAEQFATLINNALVNLKGCDYLVLAGLSAEQKSYLYFLEGYNVITIDTVTDISFLLSAFLPTDCPTLTCRPEEILAALYMAIQSGAVLAPNPMADPLPATIYSGDSLVIVEAEPYASAVTGVHYACAVGAAFACVAGLTIDEANSITPLIQGWQEGDARDFQCLQDLVISRVHHINFPAYGHATFFTGGLPYSLVLENQISFCHVHSLYRPDFFVFNSILRHYGPADKAAVVFSPVFFKEEETEKVADGLVKQGFYLRRLTGKEASLFHLDMHIKEFPFDLFHICSHGGEVGGFAVTDQFTDRDGTAHTIEFDDVMGYSLVPWTDKVRVQFKTYPRKFDGLPWGSAALKQISLPDYVFADMHNHFRLRRREKTPYPGVPKKSIPGSCAIRCSDSIYQGMFHSLACHGAPVIFNNTCWSAFGISECFLVGGARGYIGTLWAVGNDVAVAVANAFYANLHQIPVMDALHVAAKLAGNSSSAHIYHYWGLPFTRVRAVEDSELSRYAVFLDHIQGLKSWERHGQQSTRPEIKAEARRLYLWHGEQLLRYFPEKDMRALKEKLSR